MSRKQNGHARKRMAEIFRAIMERPWILIVFLILVSLAVRLPLASLEGYGYDVGVNQGWARSGVMLGLARSYVEQVGGNMLPNYPPLSIMMFTAVGYAYHSMSPGFDMGAMAFRILIKMPAILADVVTVVVLFGMIRRKKGALWGLLVGLAYALHPAVIYDSAVWGQTDAVYTLALVLALSSATQRRWVLSGLWSAAAVLLKAQAIVWFPVLAILAVPSDVRIGKILTGGIIMTAAVLLPFYLGKTLPAVVGVYTNSVGQNTSLSAGAYNLWLGLYGGSAGRSDTELFFGIVQYRFVGFLLFGAVTASALWILRRSLWITTDTRRPSVLHCMLAAYLIACGFYLFNNEMHERYMFPAMAFGVALLATGPAGITLYVASSLCFLLNLVGILPYGVIDRGLFHEFSELPQFIGTVQSILLIVTVAHVQRWARSHV